MTREEKEKAIDALKISAPVMVVTQEKFNDYIQTINKIMDWLEQEPKTGHWIESDIPNEKYNCSECGGACWYYDYQGDVAKSRFCPNCGAKME